jgi:hypothetical protein
MNMRQIMSLLSEEKFGEDEADYFRRQMQEQAVSMLANQVSLGDLREACRLKYLQFEVRKLLLDISEGSQGARDRALTILLKEVFYV